MARDNEYQLTPDEKALYSKLSRSVKNKIKRVEENYGVKLGGEIRVPAPDMFPSRAEFTRWRKQAESFTDRNNRKYQYVKNKFGIVASKAYLDELQENTKRAQKLSKEFTSRFDERPIIAKGKPIGVTVGEQKMFFAKPDKGIGKVRDFNFDDITSRDTLTRRFETARLRSEEAYYENSLITMQDNFIRSVEGSFNSEADYLVDLLRLVPPDAFYELYSIYNEIDFEIFDSEGQFINANEDILSRIEMYVEDYLAGKTDMSLKGF
ncbi:DNA terminal protein [Bacillus phage Karezi]|uniref:DNA terminal protein n=1 Tax=Bacillus phage Karezi TaxID=2591398 RepID=A0A514AAM3_9CAUD|nr:DNA terminal protein [Bacillus phage Karezi]QDH50333.1 DNA terminal protein [Bacillus phage Karezi]